jgi:hypothetical protein
VTARTPAANATAVAVDAPVTATFSEAVQKVDDTTFTLKAGGTVYTATLTGGSSGIKNLTGTPLATTPAWTFTTAGTTPPADTAAPTVIAKDPVANGTAVPVGKNVTATFSEPVQGVSGATFKLRRVGASSDTTATVTYNATTRVATLDPSANLTANSQYTATLTGGGTAVRDLANNALATVPWTFTTAAPQTPRRRP